MTCFDIIFPLALGPLTYRCPPGIQFGLQSGLEHGPEHGSDHGIEPGMIVTAPLRNRLAKGVVLRRNDSPPTGPLKDLFAVEGPGLPKSMVRLLVWMSEYYLAPEGLLLKQTVPPEVFEKTSLHKQRKAAGGRQLEFPEALPCDPGRLDDALKERRFHPFLYHADSSLHEYALARSLAEKTSNLIVLVPEISHADMLYRSLHGQFQERVCVLHSEMSKGRRSAYVDGIMDGRHDIVIGNRLALFSPLKKVSCILVLQEHSVFYKMEDGVRFHLRDVAVKRASLEKAAVVLSSITPSIDSYYNALTGKYELICTGHPAPSPRISVVDMRYAKKASRGISKTAVNLAGSRLGIGKKVMFVVNRKGYATLLCRECENIEACPECNIPTVMHKDGMTMRCHYCGRETKIPMLCSRCKSPSLEPVGSGTERVQEELEKLLRTKALVIDRDRIKKRSDLTSALKTLSEGGSNLIIGTKLLTTHISILDRFSLAVVLNIDASMNFPDFRASEKAYAELSSLLDNLETEGDLLIQTRNPANPMLKYFKSGDYRSFVNEELQMRKTLSFPPFSRMAAVTVAGRTDLSQTIIRHIRSISQGVEVLGPVSSAARHGGTPQLSIILKAADRRALNRTARSVADAFGDRKDVLVRIDVDPA
ncbi:MAG: primosomal protein N' [Nitrospiraceae bacterium]|nr:primosomal protein N' [Nitrospiraceae bacterium]